ncbi:MAG: alpha-L-fucosidase, partial [candidate division KSB1 bacterium]|nr:alpha-L-fucosidase [candidate division KSB1 bacterium]
MKKVYLTLWIFSLATIMLAQESEETYVPETDPLVVQKLEHWQDLKFGLLMHWGPYSQWGVVESWSICSEDWITRPIDNYEEYKRQYKELKKTFNPVNFNPDKWATAAKEAGMKYLVFTTKHHDGFCMFDTKTTDYKITSSECPFHSHPRANITKEIFEAFRKEGFMIGAYFSKPDWNCEDYWWPYYATPDRHVNYDPARHPERWQRFKDYTYNQIEELMTGYGTIDILWLDGAWVRPYENIPEEYESWARKNTYNQDVDIPRIAQMARQHQPGLIIVDRWVSGPYENYLTPEQKVPEKALTVPWEACITMAPGWSYNKEHHYKPVWQLVHLLVDIVAKGGNFLLNIGPSPEGDWAPEAYDRLKGIGDWLKINSEAIYGTRPISRFKDGKVCLTQNKTSGAVYAIYLADENETHPPAKIWLNRLQPASRAQVTMLGVPGKLSWQEVGNGVLIDIPQKAQHQPPCLHAWTVKIS